MTREEIDAVPLEELGVYLGWVITGRPRCFCCEGVHSPHRRPGGHSPAYHEHPGATAIIERALARHSVELHDVKTDGAQIRLQAIRAGAVIDEELVTTPTDRRRAICRLAARLSALDVLEE